MITLVIGNNFASTLTNTNKSTDVTPVDSARELSNKSLNPVNTKSLRPGANQDNVTKFIPKAAAKKNTLSNTGLLHTLRVQFDKEESFLINVLESGFQTIDKQGRSISS